MLAMGGSSAKIFGNGAAVRLKVPMTVIQSTDSLSFMGRSVAENCRGGTHNQRAGGHIFHVSLPRDEQACVRKCVALSVTHLVRIHMQTA